MTSAPSHMEHEPECFREKAWEAINDYVRACGGYPTGKRADDLEARGAKYVINTLLKKAEP